MLINVTGLGQDTARSVPCPGLFSRRAGRDIRPSADEVDVVVVTVARRGVDALHEVAHGLSTIDAPATKARPTRPSVSHLTSDAGLPGMVPGGSVLGRGCGIG